MIRDADRELKADEGASMFKAITVKAIICCPLVKEGQLVTMMAVHQDIPRDWAANDVSLVNALVELSWVHIERMRATDALRKSEAHFSSLFEQTAAGIAVSDMTGRITHVSDRYCQVLHRSRDEIICVPMQDLTHPEDLPRNLVLFENMVKHGESFDIEKRYLLPNGSCAWVNTTVSLIRSGGDKRAESMLAVALDITERKRPAATLTKIVPYAGFCGQRIRSLDRPG